MCVEAFSSSGIRTVYHSFVFDQVKGFPGTALMETHMYDNPNTVMGAYYFELLPEKCCKWGTTHSVQFGCPGKRARVLAGAFLPRIASDAYFRNTTNADPFSPCDDAEKCACAHRSAFLLAANPNQSNLRGLLHVHV